MFERYISETEIPIVAEFAYKNDVPRDLLYQWDEFLTLLKNCTAKKETQLERKALGGKVNAAVAIFSLKQLGWSDKVDASHRVAYQVKDCDRRL